MRVNKISLLPVLLLALQKLYGMDIEISGKELSSVLTLEYNRSFYFCGDIAASGAVKLNERYTVKSGFALGMSGINVDIKWFAGAEVALPVRIPFSIGLAYNYNGLPKYKTHTHSLPLLVSYQGRWAGVYLGTNFRFTNFLNEAPVFEPILLFSIYVNFIYNDRVRFGLKTANFDDFTYGNIGAYFLNLYSTVRLNQKLSLVNEIEMRQSGSIALSSNFYGFVYRGGVVFSW